MSRVLKNILEHLFRRKNKLDELHIQDVGNHRNYRLWGDVNSLIVYYCEIHSKSNLGEPSLIGMAIHSGTEYVCLIGDPVSGNISDELIIEGSTRDAQRDALVRKLVDDKIKFILQGVRAA